MRRLQKRVNRNPEKNRKGPLGHAFVTRNPLLPQEMFAPSGIDRTIVSMNRGIKYSLLDCPGKYTVRIATFRGRVVIDQKEIRDIEQNDRTMKSKLDDAAEQANRLVHLLRKQRVEAYQYHDRHSSYVTVGHFNSLGRPADGIDATEIDPKIYAVMKKYGPERKPVVGQSGGAELALIPQKISGIQLDVQPYPMEVPRHSIAADYVRR